MIFYDARNANNGSCYNTARGTLSVILLVAALLIIVLSGCTQKRGKAPTISCAEKPLSIILATDLHYISPQLTDGGASFLRVVENADGKAMPIIEEITDAFIATVISAKPDVLLMSGDIAFNGAKLSHKDLAKKLAQVKNAGIDVCVIPGNHDINYQYAAKFFGERNKPVASVSARNFFKIYSDMGFSSAVLSRDKNSGSYIFSPRSDFRIIMLDTNSVTANSISAKTLLWLENELKKAKNENAHVISVTHQTLLSHNKMFFDGFVIQNANQIVELYKKYNVICNFCGHMHIQHIKEQDGFAEVITSSMAVSPQQFGLINFDGENFSYKTNQLDIDVWAVSSGRTLPDALAQRDFVKDAEGNSPTSFSEYSKNFFYGTARRQFRNREKNSQIPFPQIDEMMHAAMEINYNYFSGTKTDLSKYRDVVDLWQSYEEGFFSVYLNRIMADTERDHHDFSVTIRTAGQ